MDNFNYVLKQQQQKLQIKQVKKKVSKTISRKEHLTLFKKKKKEPRKPIQPEEQNICKHTGTQSIRANYK